MQEIKPPGIKGWWDLSCAELVESAQNINKDDVKVIPGFDMLISRIEECLRDGKVEKDQAERAISHLRSITTRK